MVRQNNKDIEERIKSVFEKLKAATTIEILKNIPTESGISRIYHFNENKYPTFDFEIKKEEINSLIDLGVIDKQGIINPSKLEGVSKLFYAFLWKQGDLNKLHLILDGILENSNNSKSIVFSQFGKHLANRNSEPIVDQHVLRAVAYDKMPDDALKKKTVFKNEDLIEYKLWIKNNLTRELKSCNNYMFEVDKILFMIGKYIKSS